MHGELRRRGSSSSSSKSLAGRGPASHGRPRRGRGRARNRAAPFNSEQLRQRPDGRPTRPSARTGEVCVMSMKQKQKSKAAFADGDLMTALEAKTEHIKNKRSSPLRPTATASCRCSPRRGGAATTTCCGRRRTRIFHPRRCSRGTRRSRGRTSISRRPSNSTAPTARSRAVPLARLPSGGGRRSRHSASSSDTTTWPR